jgi:putative Ca2+/H+ antiporter (TMEM165/GDT1 family)
MELADFWKVVSSTFAVVFLAELGDKTQLATMLLAGDQPGARWAVFLGSAAALVVASAIGVMAGAWIAYHVPERALKIVASLGFIVMGLWILRSALPS